MDFDDSPAEASFRQKVRKWLEENGELKQTPRQKFAPELNEAERLASARRWQAKKALAGFAGITLPCKYGGRAGSHIQQVIYQQEESAFLVPFGFYEIGLCMCIPTILAYASEEQKERYVPKALAGEEIWCQLFSEPAAGSDLAGVQTSARRDGGSWVLNGQKVWTTGAHFSNYGIVLARSEPEKPKHKGLTMFFLPMNSPGIEIRPIAQMPGGSDFNEVFFTDVRVPDSNRLGEAGDGWQVALTTLKHERLTVGSDIGLIDVDDVVSLLKRIDRNNDPFEESLIQERLVDWHIQSQGIRLLNQRAITALSKGDEPGPELSITKLIAAKAAQQMANFCMDLMGEQALLGAEHLGDKWESIEHSWYWSAAMRIAGGTDEVLRNIIAERVLQLPQENRPDKREPYNSAT